MTLTADPSRFIEKLEAAGSLDAEVRSSGWSS